MTLDERLKLLGRPLKWSLSLNGGPMHPMSQVDQVEVCQAEGRTYLAVIGTCRADDPGGELRDYARLFTLDSADAWTRTDDDDYGVDFTVGPDVHRFERLFDEIDDMVAAERWLAYLKTSKGRSFVSGVKVQLLPEARTTLAASEDVDAAALLGRPEGDEPGGAANDADTVEQTTRQETYYWAEEAHRQADGSWSRVRVWIYDPFGQVWLAFQAPNFEDESRRMMGRLNFYGTTLANLEDYLSNWGYDQKSVSTFAPMQATSVADVVAEVWPGATAVSGTSDEQALGELDPTGIGRHGEPKKGWGER